MNIEVESAIKNFTHIKSGAVAQSAGKAFAHIIGKKKPLNMKMSRTRAFHW